MQTNKTQPSNSENAEGISETNGKKTLRVIVKAEDVRKGAPNCGAYCAVALAACRATEAHLITVGEASVCMWLTENVTTVFYPRGLDSRNTLRVFTQQFDSGVYTDDEMIENWLTDKDQTLHMTFEVKE